MTDTITRATNAAVRALKDERAYLVCMRDATAPESAFHASYVQDIAEIDAAVVAITAEKVVG